MRHILRSVALASVLALGGLLALGTSEARAQGYGGYQGGYGGGYPGGSYAPGYGGNYGSGYGRYYGSGPVGYPAVGGYGQGYGGYGVNRGYAASGYFAPHHHHQHRHHRGCGHY